MTKICADKRIIQTVLCLLLVMTVMTSCSMQGVTSAETDAAGTRMVDITMEGGTGKAHILSPVEVTETDGKLTAKLVWSSTNYDYMIAGGIRYENENPGGASTFTIGIDNTEEPLKVTADTVAMSVPHEIEYTILWGQDSSSKEEESYDASTDPAAVEKALKDAGFEKTGTCDLKYAKGFTIDRYGDLDYISIANSGDYLLVPEGADIPEDLAEKVRVLSRPVECTYLVSTSAMDLINACGALDAVKLSGTKESDWYIDEAKEAMKNGSILYAGKYSAPDYELILESGCGLAIENTMIYHEPAVMTKLEELGIPVLVETSSYEDHPLGRLEWIKLYGVLFDRESEAEDYFERQMDMIRPLLEDAPDTGKTVAFFHVTANGLINVRRNGDYITKMIEISGGHYVPENAGDGQGALSTLNMQMEDFYEGASQADIIIYNSTIGGEIRSVEELIDKNPLFKDFRAVKESEVYCTDRNLFQQVSGMAEFMRDLNDVENGVDRNYSYLNRLE
ncbi:MAG: ABC transporter substrate-binding protein [Lachnospiraceae bacterium]|nr:ABC transporter substrate-binding protein [Lachnospiraceae bacterium]